MPPKSLLKAESINMSHGGGGKAMRDLIEDLILGAFDNPELALLEDQARIEMSALNNLGSRLALTTDSYVVDPLFFRGGDIGKLAVSGTVNDLAVGGAIPLFLTCGFIIEEGFPVSDLRKILDSMKSTAAFAGVKIVTGDTKVVNRGAADKIFINTAGVGVIPSHLNIGAHRAMPGDVVIVNGFVGDHGAAIMAARSDLAIDSDIASDCCPLNKLIERLVEACPEVHCMRDATRGGIASVLNEFAAASQVCVRLKESAIPLRPEVRGLCEILGLDPLYLANEGKIIAIVPKESAAAALNALKQDPAGRNARIVGEVVSTPSGIVVLETVLGGERIVDMLIGDQLPRIC